MAGYMPFFIQIACAHALENLDDHPGREKPDFEEVYRSFYKEASIHYRFIWSGLANHERSALVRVVNGKGVPDSMRHILSELETRNLVKEDSHRPEVFSSSFADFIRLDAKGKKASLLQRLMGRG